MNWWRAHHGIATDPKYAVVLRHIASHCVTDRLVTTRAEILAVWVWLIDFSSQNEPRGSIAGIDPAQIAVTLDIPDATVESIISACRKFGMITDNSLKSWIKRQPQREDDSTDRTRKWREGKKHIVTHGDADVTHGDADVTHGDAVTPSRGRARDLLSYSLTSIENKSTSNGNGSVSGVLVNGNVKSYDSDESFTPFLVAAMEFWPDLITEDLYSSWQFTWKKLDFEQKLDIVTRLRARIDSGEDARFVTRPPKYLETGAWKRPPRIRANGSRNETREERINRELLEDCKS